MLVYMGSILELLGMCRLLGWGWDYDGFADFCSRSLLYRLPREHLVVVVVVVAKEHLREDHTS